MAMFVSGSSTSTGSFGQVSIGISTPAYDKLHIHADGKTNQFGITTDNTGAALTDGFGIAVISNNDVQILQKENASMKFATDDSVRMTISASGQVGIGVTDPDNALEVNGDISTSSHNQAIMARYNNGNNYTGQFKNGKKSCIIFIIYLRI